MNFVTIAILLFGLCPATEFSARQNRTSGEMVNAGPMMTPGQRFTESYGEAPD